MLEQHVVDLGRVDVAAAEDDEVGAAVGEEEVAVVVDVPDVAQGEVVAAVRRLGLVAVLEVLEAPDVGRLEVDRADRAGRELVAVVVGDLDVIRRIDLADGAGLARATCAGRPTVPVPSVAA